MVVTIMRAPESAICLASCAVEWLAETVPTAYWLYVLMVWWSRSLRSTTKMTLSISISSMSATSFAVLKEVRVLPEPVVCQMYPPALTVPVSLLSDARLMRSSIASVAAIW